MRFERNCRDTSYRALVWGCIFIWMPAQLPGRDSCYFSPYYSPGNLLIQPAQVRQVLQTIVPAWLRFLCQKLVIFVSPGKPHEVIMEFCLHLGNHT